MSASYALIKFKKTGNIYWGCYEGTSDILNPYICTGEECYVKNVDHYCSISYCRDLSRGKSWMFPDNINDLDEVEIYSDYGSGFYWAGTGSESLKMIKTGTNTIEEGIDVTFGQPDWVKKFDEEIENTEGVPANYLTKTYDEKYEKVYGNYPRLQ